VHRVDHVARLGLLRDAGRGAEGEHLVALRRGGPVGENDDPGLGERLVQLEDLRRRLQAPEVDERDRRAVALDGPLDRLVRDVALD
jgi:hypothetical protein